MRVIFLQTVKNSGKKGEIKEVSEGYARNFLLPRRLAQPATLSAVKNLKAKKEEGDVRENLILKELEKKASSLKGKRIEIFSKAKDEKLFGSISVKDVVRKLKESGFEVEEKSVLLESPIKTIGERKIEVDFGRGVKSELVIIVSQEK